MGEILTTKIEGTLIGSCARPRQACSWEVSVKQIRIERPKYRRDRADAELLPLDPRDADIVRAKALSRAAREPAAEPEA